MHCGVVHTQGVARAKFTSPNARAPSTTNRPCVSITLTITAFMKNSSPNAHCVGVTRSSSAREQAQRRGEHRHTGARVASGAAAREGPGGLRLTNRPSSQSAMLIVPFPLGHAAFVPQDAGHQLWRKRPSKQAACPSAFDHYRLAACPKAIHEKGMQKTII